MQTVLMSEPDGWLRRRERERALVRRQLLHEARLVQPAARAAGLPGKRLWALGAMLALAVAHALPHVLPGVLALIKSNM